MRLLPVSVAIVTRIRRLAGCARGRSGRCEACSTTPPAWPWRRSCGRAARLPRVGALRRAPAQFRLRARGATVGCGVKECPRSFHAPCALFRSGGCVNGGNRDLRTCSTAARIAIKGRTGGCRARACPRRRWKGPVDATGEPLLAPDAADLAELGSAYDALHSPGRRGRAHRRRRRGAGRRHPSSCKVGVFFVDLLLRADVWNARPYRRWFQLPKKPCRLFRHHR